MVSMEVSVLLHWYRAKEKSKKAEFLTKRDHNTVTPVTHSPPTGISSSGRFLGLRTYSATDTPALAALNASATPLY